MLQTSGVMERVSLNYISAVFANSRSVAEFMADKVEEFALASGKLDNIRVWFNNKVNNCLTLGANILMIRM